jgi:hypothetical protein
MPKRKLRIVKRAGTSRCAEYVNIAMHQFAAAPHRLSQISLLFHRGSLDLRGPLRITPSLSRRSRLPRRPPAQPIEMRVHHGTHFPSVLSSFSYTAGLRHSFIKELQGIGALY